MYAVKYEHGGCIKGKNILTSSGLDSVIPYLRHKLTRLSHVDTDLNYLKKTTRFLLFEIKVAQVRKLT